MTDEQKQAIQDEQAARQKAKEAYDKEMERVEPIRKAWIAADLEVRRLFKQLNVTKADSVFRD